MGRGRCKYAYVTVGYATVGRAILRQIFLKIAVKLLSSPSNPQPRRCVTTARSSWFALLAAVRGPAASRQIWFLAGRWPDWCARRCEAPASDCPAPGQAGHAERSSLGAIAYWREGGKNKPNRVSAPPRSRGRIRTSVDGIKTRSHAARPPGIAARRKLYLDTPGT